jgi:hypothetical protein
LTRAEEDDVSDRSIAFDAQRMPHLEGPASRGPSRLRFAQAAVAFRRRRSRRQLPLPE